ncbi:MAG: hypothetical protein KF749_07465 [Bacteroidetes bacterium]|nr:hypothetical protein [Bacteroidota bacterium]MCW5896823.1 hypothetical protein [Bacteroidota bacterium]
MMPSPPHSLLRRKSFVSLLYLFTAMYVFGVWVWSADTPTTSFNSDPRSKLSELIYGTAHKPYVQRVLVPLVTRGVFSIVSGSAIDSIEKSLLELPKVQKETARLGWETDFFMEYLIALAFAFATLVAFPFVIRELWARLYNTDESITDIIPLLALLALPPIFPTGPHYIYDLPALLLFTSGMLFMIEQRWALFYTIFALGCLNKETMVLLALLFAMLYRKEMGQQTLVLHLVAQAFLFAVIKLIIMNAFADNPGPVMDFHLNLNLHILLSGYNLVPMIVAGFTLWLVFSNYNSKHVILRAALLLAVPLGFLVLVSGVITELRAVLELYPIVLLLALHTIFFTLLKVPYQKEPFPINPATGR